MSDVHWKKAHRRTGIDFRCQDANEVYLSFNWNGTMVWEYCCTAEGGSAKAFAKYLREVADKIEATAQRR